MKTCEHCGGDLLRHAVKTLKRPAGMIGIRYRCRDCGKSFTQRMKADVKRGKLFFNETGRPTLKDWRSESEGDRGTPGGLSDDEPRAGVSVLSPPVHRVVALNLWGRRGCPRGSAGQRSMEGEKR